MSRIDELVAKADAMVARVDALCASRKDADENADEKEDRRMRRSSVLAAHRVLRTPEDYPAGSEEDARKFLTDYYAKRGEKMPKIEKRPSKYI